MADFVRLARGYRLTQKTTDITGQEQFLRHDSAPGSTVEASLPRIGTTPMLDAAGATISSCLARTKTTTYQDDDASTPLIQYDYSLRDTSFAGTPGSGIDTTPETRSVQIGIETVSVDDPSGSWKWQEMGTDVEQPLSKNVVVGEFTIPKGPLTKEEMSTFIGVVIARAGRINANTSWDSEFGNNFAVGQVLFMGLTGGTTTDEDGDIKYQFNMHFAYRVINDFDVDNAAIASNDWQYILATGDAGSVKGWARPQTKTGSRFLYETADFSGLI